MSDRLRLAVIVVAIALLLGAPVVLIALRADSGSAAFGDVEQVGRNRLSAATLDIEAGSRAAPIRVVDLAPGDLVAGQAEFRNAGTLPLSYALEATASAPQIGGDLTWWFRFSEDGACPSEAGWRAGPSDAVEIDGVDVTATAAVTSQSAAEGIRAARRLDVDERQTICLAVELDIEASNEAQSTTVDLELVARAVQIADDDADDDGDDETEERP